MLSITGKRIQAHTCIGPSGVMPNIITRGTPVTLVSLQHFGTESFRVGRKSMFPLKNNVGNTTKPSSLPCAAIPVYFYALEHIMNIINQKPFFLQSTASRFWKNRGLELVFLWGVLFSPFTWLTFLSNNLNLIREPNWTGFNQEFLQLEKTLAKVELLES